MAKSLWGRVYLYNKFAGILRQEPGERMSFTYDLNYIENEKKPISYTLQLQEESYISEDGLHPFFDNLVAEGWLEQAQGRLLGKRNTTRFELLLAFGYDCIGAISVIDPDPIDISKKFLNDKDPKEIALIKNRASLSGVQPKLALIKDNNGYRTTQIGEISTHIAKFSSENHRDLIYNEYLTMLAYKYLMPDDNILEVFISEIKDQDEPALVIKRFDRELDRKIHFEEFNQLMGNKSTRKYEGSHKQMSEFILSNKSCLPIENYKLFRRIITGILLGNTDMHLKNFSMFHKEEGLRLTPSYDQVNASIYGYKNIALTLAGEDDVEIGKIKAKHILALGKEFQLETAVIHMAVNVMSKNIEKAKNKIFESNFGSKKLKDNLIKHLEKKWNGIFSLIGKKS